MSVNIQTKNGLFKVAENCGCESGEPPLSEPAITAQPVEMVDELRIGDYSRLTGVQAFSPETITAQPVEDVTDLYNLEV